MDGQARRASWVLRAHRAPHAEGKIWNELVFKSRDLLEQSSMQTDCINLLTKELNGEE